MAASVIFIGVIGLLLAILVSPAVCFLLRRWIARRVSKPLRWALYCIVGTAWLSVVALLYEVERFPRAVYPAPDVVFLLRHYWWSPASRFPPPRWDAETGSFRDWKAPGYFTDAQIHALFARALDPRLDGEYAETYSGQLIWVMVTAGDSRFAGLLAKEPPRIQRATVERIARTFPFQKRPYPRTEALCPDHPAATNIPADW